LLLSLRRRCRTPPSGRWEVETVWRLKITSGRRGKDAGVSEMQRLTNGHERETVGRREEGGGKGRCVGRGWEGGDLEVDCEESRRLRWFLSSCSRLSVMAWTCAIFQPNAQQQPKNTKFTYIHTYTHARNPQPTTHKPQPTHPPTHPPTHTHTPTHTHNHTATHIPPRSGFRRKWGHSAQHGR